MPLRPRAIQNVIVVEVGTYPPELVTAVTWPRSPASRSRQRGDKFKP